MLSLFIDQEEEEEEESFTHMAIKCVSLLVIGVGLVSCDSLVIISYWRSWLVKWWAFVWSIGVTNRSCLYAAYVVDSWIWFWARIVCWCFETCVFVQNDFFVFSQVTIFADPMCDVLDSLTNSKNKSYIPISGKFFIFSWPSRKVCFQRRCQSHRKQNSGPNIYQVRTRRIRETPIMETTVYIC